MTIVLIGKKTKQIALIAVLMFISICHTLAQDKKVVYITKTGEKYHTSGCRYLKYSSIAIDLDKAKERGYTACSVCKPGAGSIPTSTDNNNNDTNRTVPVAPVQKTQTATTKQCSATTQAGSRCKRNTSDPSGKCWQHQ